VDVVLAVVLSALGAFAMVMNMGAEGQEVRIDSTSWLMVPVWLAATVPVLWWRRNLNAVIGVSVVAMAVHVLAFGWVVRCGPGLPLVFVLAFLCCVAYPWRQALWSVAGVVALAFLVLVQDSAAGPDLLPAVVLIVAVMAGIGSVVRQRSSLAAQLEERNEELSALRDERAALSVSDDRAQLSQELGTLLDERLTQLALAADAVDPAGDPVAQRTALVRIEEEGRRTLGDMREVVGLLRGGEAGVAPAPSVAHLDALLAKHLGADARLRVIGDPRVLPASVELSAYRIVEHLVTALARDPRADLDVAMGFGDDALEVSVTGPVPRGADLRGAVGRARERADLHQGSLDVTVTKGRANVVAHLPVLTEV
jgi:signal transduction histidine kinase